MRTRFLRQNPASLARSKHGQWAGLTQGPAQVPAAGLGRSGPARISRGKTPAARTRQDGAPATQPRRLRRAAASQHSRGRPSSAPDGPVAPWRRGAAGQACASA